MSSKMRTILNNPPNQCQSRIQSPPTRSSQFMNWRKTRLKTRRSRLSVWPRSCPPDTSWDLIRSLITSLLKIQENIHHLFTFQKRFCYILPLQGRFTKAPEDAIEMACICWRTLQLETSKTRNLHSSAGMNVHSNWANGINVIFETIQTCFFSWTAKTRCKPQV